MPPLPLYLVDAFAKAPFKGNPAAVCPLPHWLPDELLQAITIEHNQSETAFFVPASGVFELRWFTTANGEINLCGHATLASAHVIFSHLLYPADEIIFQSRFSGELRVRRAQDWLTLDFPAWPPEPVADIPECLIHGLGGMKPLACMEWRDYLLRYANEADVQDAQPDFVELAKAEKRVCITAPGQDVDFVSRFFCPGDALPEDPVTGSSHSMLIPYWAQQLGKTRLTARQLSARGGELRCELAGERVLISGQARTYATGHIFLP